MHQGPNELDVAAVYTAERPDQPAIQFAVENIAPRLIQTDKDPCRA